MIGKSRSSLFISVIHLAFAIHSVYYYLIMKFGHIDALNSVIWTFKVQALLNFATVMSVQGLYAWRVRTVGKHFSNIWPWVVVGIVGVGWVFGITLMVNIVRTPTWDEVSNYRWILYTAFIFATFIDFVIATTLCYYLTMNRSSFHRTNNRILRIMHYVLACGFLTSACSLGAFITLATMPKTLIFIGMDFLLPRMYMLSYMTMLNARRDTPEKEASSFNVTGALNQFRMGQHSTWTDQTERKPTTMETELSAQDSIPLAHSKSPIGITIHGTENRHYDTQI
ncbi:hypothetical protein M413DRAFT_395415 [Hebeloma cylindrosporum]|uniref:DUF6534 domain-containing protein n=1 Tax=Hebeloma cylindrosporum TaxID=76867 RepID=A0A0C2YPW1_HEBCY|nr:hypothetical protein M413DRAFT_395415 [Hebeloma cylindrosporum h7]